jgi:arylsulfatase A-like enzyme
MHTRLKLLGFCLVSVLVVIGVEALGTTSGSECASGERRETCQASAGQKPPNVILYLVDTLRPDHLGVYGAGTGASPALDDFATKATVFEQAWAQASWTRPAVASIFTGMRPRTHGVNQRDSAIPADFKTLAQRLKPLGYESAGFVTNANVGKLFGFGRGFARYELLSSPESQVGYASSTKMVDRALAWLDARKEDAPFFLYLHASEPHDPYAYSGQGPEEPGTMNFMMALETGGRVSTPAVRAELLARYAKDVALADAGFGRFVSELTSRGLFEDSLIIFLSDHGEEFGEHGWWRHGKTLYNEQLSVPLIIRWPGGIGARQRVAWPSQQIDILPTVIAAAGAEVPADLPGMVLGEATIPGGRRDTPAIQSYLNLEGREIESVIQGTRKLLRYLEYDLPKPSVELFDLDRDPGELKNRAGKPGDAPAELAALFDGGNAAGGDEIAPESVVLDEEIDRRLRALGYIE